MVFAIPAAMKKTGLHLFRVNTLWVVRARDHIKATVFPKPVDEPGPTPQCLFDAYGINVSATEGVSMASMAVVEFAGSYYLETDLSTFQRAYGVAENSVSIIEGTIPKSATAGIRNNTQSQARTNQILRCTDLPITISLKPSSSVS